MADEAQSMKLDPAIRDQVLATVPSLARIRHFVVR